MPWPCCEDGCKHCLVAPFTWKFKPRLVRAPPPGCASPFKGNQSIVSLVGGIPPSAIWPNWESLAEIFASQYIRFPLRSIRESGDLYRPLALSDIASRRAVESLDLYHDYYRVLSVADDLSVNFGDLSHRVCLAVLRGRRGFSTQDRAILVALRPHLELAYRYANALAAFPKAA